MIEVEEKKNLYRDEFETVFGVKKNIQALRNKVLDLAIQGKLVEQDPRDEPARELLLRIQSEKKKLIKEKIIKTEKPLPVIEKDDIPFVLPESWQWIRMGEIATKIHYGYTASANESGNAQMLRITDIQNGKVQWDNVPYCTIDDGKINQYKLEENDIVIARTGGTVGKSFLIKDINSVSVFASYLIRIVLTYPEVANYVNFFLDSPYYWKVIGIQSKGTGQPNVNAKQLSSIMVPFPPLAEQKRIVDKIETLMKQINKLEEQLEEKEKLETLIPKAVVTALSNSQDEEELKKNLALVIENFTEVFRTPESLEEFRGVILQLGVQGKLLPQNMKDEPVEKLLEEIQTTKGKKLQTINTKEAPHFIPDTWAWIKFGDLVDFNMGKTAPRKDASYWKDGIYNWVSIADMDDGKHLQNTKEKVTEKAKINIFKEKIAPKGTLLMSFKLTIGKMAILDMEAFHNEAIISIYPNNKEPKVIRDYLFRIGKGLDMLKGSKNAIKGATLNKTSLNNISVPLPPLQEQKRIVAKIESIFAVVDQLEEEMKRRDRIVETMAVI